MRRLVLVLSILLLAASANAAYIETFDTDNAGFLYATVSDGGSVSEGAAAWSGTGGNPDGHIQGYLDNDNTRLYGMFKYAGATDFGDLTGTWLRVDFKIDGAVTYPDPANVRFYIGSFTGEYNYFVTKDSYSWDPNGDTAWTTHKVAMLAGNFIEWPNQAAHTKTFEELLYEYEDIGLVFTDGDFTQNPNLGFGSLNGATIAMDNFGSAVPVPAAAWLLGSGLLGLFLVRRKMKK